MPNYYAMAFGSYNYSTGNADGARWNEGHGVRPALVQVPGSPIARAITGALGPRQVTIEGSILGDGWSSEAQLRGAQDAFAAAHGPGYRALYRDDDRYLLAEVRSLSYGERDGLLKLDYTVQFEAADPHYYDATLNTDTVASPVSGAAHVITNAGSWTAAPIYRFTLSSAGSGSTTVPSITLARAAPSALSFTLMIPTALTIADVIEVDVLAQTVTLNGANRLSWFAGDFAELAAGANTLSVTLANTLALSSWSTLYRNRYL